MFQVRPATPSRTKQEKKKKKGGEAERPSTSLSLWEITSILLHLHGNYDNDLKRCIFRETVGDVKKKNEINKKATLEAIMKSSSTHFDPEKRAAAVAARVECPSQVGKARVHCSRRTCASCTCSARATGVLAGGWRHGSGSKNRYRLSSVRIVCWYRSLSFYLLWWSACLRRVKSAGTDCEGLLAAMSKTIKKKKLRASSTEMRGRILVAARKGSGFVKSVFPASPLCGVSPEKIEKYKGKVNISAHMGAQDGKFDRSHGAPHKLRHSDVKGCPEHTKLGKGVVNVCASSLDSLVRRC